MCPGVGLLCVIQPLMFSCKHCCGKINVYLPSHCLSSSVSHHSPFFFAIVHLPSIPLSETFPHPPMLYSMSTSPIFSSPQHPTALHHPPSLASITPTPPFLPSSLFPPLAFLCSGPIDSHYTDGPDDSVE